MSKSIKAVIMGNCIPSSRELDKLDAWCDDQRNSRIQSAKKELSQCEYREVRQGRIGIEYRLYREDGAFTLASSPYTGAARVWYVERKDGVYCA